MTSFLSRLLSDYLFVPHELERRAARKSIRSMKGRLIDVGCGRKPYLAFFPAGRKHIFMDSDASREPTVIGSVDSIPFPAHSFDGVVMTEVLEHVPDPDRALKEVRRVLKKGGRLYLSTPFLWGLHYAPYDFCRWTHWGLRRILERNGFRVLRVRRIGGLFSAIYARLLDVILLGWIIRPFERLHLRGGWRLAALIAAMPNLLAYVVCNALDRLDRADALGWSVIAESTFKKGR